MTGSFMPRPISYGSFTSTQYVEIVTGDDGIETGFEIEITCRTRGTPGQLSGPPEDCYPAESPEFEITSIYVGTEGLSLSHQITRETFDAILGPVLSQDLFEAACLEAEESGEF